MRRLFEAVPQAEIEAIVRAAPAALHVRRAWYLYETLTGRTLEPVYGFRSLLAFKAKFQPSYRPLYMAYPDVAALPAIATAITRAYLPDLDAVSTLRLLRGLRT